VKKLPIFPVIDNFNSLYKDHLKYYEATWLTAHNAFASKAEGWLLYNQQHLSLEQMFYYGVRSFMIDVHYSDKILSLCHAGCTLSFFQKGSSVSSLLSYLNRIKKILDNQSDAIITLHLEDHSRNSTDIINTFELSGLKPMLLEDNPNNDNITLGFLREKNTRLIVFSDYQKERIGKDFKEKAGIFPTTFYKETVFGHTSFKFCEERINDFRASYNKTDIKLLVHNHFSKISIGSHNEINSYQKIANTVNPCILNGLYPNFITVDFVEDGNFGGARRIVEDLMLISNENHNIADSANFFSVKLKKLYQCVQKLFFEGTDNVELLGNSSIVVDSENNEL